MMDETHDDKKLDAIASTAQKWNDIAKSWHSWIPRMREWYEPATKLMLKLARIGSGSRVLDIAAGDLDQSIAVANLVGPDGYVLAIDVAEELLQIGEDTARQAGISNIETRVMDGTRLDLPGLAFDAVVCRFALMYFPDPIGSLKGINRVLRDNGRVSLVVYGVNGSPEFSLAVSAARKHLGLPEVRAAAHSLGEPAMLRQTLEKGGFSEVEIHTLDLLVQMSSTEECVNYLQATSPTLKELTSNLGGAKREEVWDTVQETLRIFEVKKGLEINHKVIVAAGSST